MRRAARSSGRITSTPRVITSLILGMLGSSRGWLGRSSDGTKRRQRTGGEVCFPHSLARATDVPAIAFARPPAVLRQIRSSLIRQPASKSRRNHTERLTFPRSFYKSALESIAPPATLPPCDRCGDRAGRNHLSWVSCIVRWNWAILSVTNCRCISLGMYWRGQHHATGRAS